MGAVVVGVLSPRATVLDSDLPRSVSMIDLALWEPYLEAFTRMLRADDPLVARAHREEMSAYIEASPDFWRGEALRTGLHERPKLEVTGWYLQVSRSRWSWR